MPKIDFSKIDDVDSYSPLPDGSYLCRLSDVEVDSTRNGDEMWKLRFVVEDGTHAGRLIFDNMVFSEAAMKRLKLICSRLGLDTDGEVDLTTDLIKGRRCVVTAQTETYADGTGKMRQRNVVPFAGYDHEESLVTANGSEDDGNDLPF